MSSHPGNSAYLRRDSATRAAVFDPSLPAELVDQLWREPTSLVETGDMMWRTGVRRTVRFDWDSKTYVLKHYCPTWWHLVRQLPQRSWASATFQATIKLLDAGIATPRPVACIENRWGSLRRDSFLMYEYVEGETLKSYLKGETHDPRPLTENLQNQLLALWQRLGDLRISLDDMHTGNFIVSPAGQLWVIDLDKTRFHRTTYMAARQHERGWEKFARSAAKCGTAEVIHLRVKRGSVRGVPSVQQQ